MSSETIEISAADLAAMPSAEVRHRVLLRVGMYTLPLGREDLVKQFVEHYDESQTLAGLLGGTPSDAFTFELAITGLINVLINPTLRLLEARGHAVDSKTDQGRRLRDEALQLQKAAEILRVHEKHELAAENEREAENLKSRLLYRGRGPRMTLTGTVACELERLLSENEDLRPGRRREIIAGLITDFVASTDAPQIRDLLRKARSRDRSNRRPRVVAVIRGAISVVRRGEAPLPAAELFDEPQPDPGRFSDAAALIIELPNEDGRN